MELETGGSKKLKRQGGTRRPHTDYLHLIRLYSARLEEAFADKPEALRLLMEMFVAEEEDSGDRIAPAIIYGGIFLGSAALVDCL